MSPTTDTAAASRWRRVLAWPPALARTLLRVVPQAVEGYFADRCPQFAAGIAYRALFSLAPLAIVLVSIFGLVLRNEGLREDVVNAIVDALPLSDQGSQDVQSAIESIATPASALGLVSLLVFAWAATGMMTSLRTGLEVAMRVERSRPMMRGKLVDAVLVVGVAALVIGAVLLNLVAQVADQTARRVLGLDGGFLPFVFRHGIPAVVTVVVVILLYRFVPARNLRFRQALAGAIVTAVLLLLISLASGWIYEKTARLSVIYGSLTAALVFLYSVYLYASALLLGAEVAAAWGAPPAPTSGPVVAQVRRAVLGLFVHQAPPETADPGEPAPPS